MTYSEQILIDLLSAVDAFCAEKNITPYRFGLDAGNDGKMIGDFRSRRRSPTLKTIDALYAHMATHPSKEART